VGLSEGFSAAMYELGQALGIIILHRAGGVGFPQVPGEMV